MDSIIWAIKHTMRDIAEIGLNCMYTSRAFRSMADPFAVCLEVINNFAGAEIAVSNAFFQQYFLSIMQDIFFVLTDTDHKSGFKLQSMVLARMFQLVESGHITVPLFDPAAVPDPTMSNSTFLKEYTANLLKSAFPHVQMYVPYAVKIRLLLTALFCRGQIQSFVLNLAEFHSDINRFKLALRDFLIQLKEFSGDNAELYLEEKEAEAQRKAEEEHSAAMRIPGMLKPSQLEDKDEDI